MDDEAVRWRNSAWEDQSLSSFSSLEHHDLIVVLKRRGIIQINFCETLVGNGKIYICILTRLVATHGHRRRRSRVVGRADGGHGGLSMKWSW